MMGEGFYRRLLVLWPRSFRRRYGNEAVEIFRQRMDEARRRGTFTRIRAWSVLLFDVLATAVSARLERSARPSRGYRAGAPLAVLQDVRLSLRGMRRRPGLAMVLILTLAFGIAGSTTVFALAEWMLLRPVPGVRDPARLVRVGVGPANDARIEGIPVSYPLSDPDFTDLRRGAHTLAGLAGFFTEEANVSTTTSLPRRVSAAVVTANYFDVLGVTPARGRTFVAADGRTGRGGRGGPAGA